MSGAASILAHQGGWDEALVIATPIVVFVVLFRAALARAAHHDGTDEGPSRR